MPTTTKTKQPVKRQTSATKPKGTVASKKRGLSRKQRGIVAGVGVLVLAVGGYFAVQAYQNNTADAASCVSKTFNKGDTGKCVKYIQRMVNGIMQIYFSDDYPKYTALDVDGKYGTKTEEAVKTLRKAFNSDKRGTKPDTGGTVGKETWWRMCEISENWVGYDTFKAGTAAGCRDFKNRWSDPSLFYVS